MIIPIDTEVKMKMALLAALAVLMMVAMFTLGWKFMEVLDARSDPSQYLIELSKCDTNAFVTVRFPGGGEFVCAPVHLPYPTKRR